MRKGKLTQAALDRAVLRNLQKRGDNVARYPGIGWGTGCIRNQADSFTAVSCGSSEGFPKSAPEYAVCEACASLLAKGATPVGVTVSLTLPENMEETELKELMLRLDKAAGEYGAAILGGHTETVPDRQTVSVQTTAIGQTATLRTAPAKEQDVVVIGTIASSAAVSLAEEFEKELQAFYSENFLYETKAMGEKKRLPEAAALVWQANPSAMYPVCRGGIFAALWELAERGGIGLSLDLKKIPIRQETVEICEYFSLNPYQLFSIDTLLAVVPDGAALVRMLEEAEIPAAVIGRTTAGRERILRNGEETRCLDKPQMDEWYRLAGRERKHPRLNIVLLEPEIPQNTGNIGRTCVATGTRLHLIEPLGFRLNEKAIQRAGMDYWKDLDVTTYLNYEDFLAKNPGAKIYMATTKAKQTYTEVQYEDDCYLMFGKESAGIPEEILVNNPDTAIRIPMNEEIRSLNLSNAAAIVLYEALRQNGFANMQLEGELRNFHW